MVRELVCVAGAGSIVLVLRAGLAGRVKELHELSEAVGNLNRGLISQLLRNDTEGVRLCSCSWHMVRITRSASLVQSTTFSPVELTLLLLAQTVASEAFGSAPSGPMPCVPLSSARTSLAVLGAASEALAPDDFSQIGAATWAASASALLSMSQL